MLFKSQSPRILITGLAGLGVEVAAVGRRGRYAVPERIEPRCSQALLNYLIFFFSCKIYSAAEGINTEFITLPRKYEHGEGKERLRLSCPTAGRGWAPTAAAARHWGGGGHRGGCPTPPLPPWGEDRAGVGLCLRSSSRPTGPQLRVGQGRSRAVCSSPFPRLSCGQPGGSAGSVGAPSGQEDGSAPLSATSAHWKSVLLREAISESSSKQKAAAQGWGEAGGEIMGGWCPRWSSAPALLSPRHRGDGGTTARWSEIWKGAELHVPAESGPRKRGFRVAALKRCP